MIFVFGSNERGVHGAGAARFAWERYGAEWGQGIGRHGDSYAIPTKDYRIKTLEPHIIKLHVEDFIGYAKSHPELEFKVTQIGCGLAGYTKYAIAPMFIDAPSNCLFDIEWKPFLPDTARYWNE